MADVIRQFGGAYVAGQTVSSAKRRVLTDLASCRTAALGGHVYRCPECQTEKVVYNSCRNRHCPTCLAHRAAKWLDARKGELLPVEYYHVVFTVPHEVSSLAVANKRVIYAILFQASAKTLKEITANPKHLGAEIGFLSILHTWTQGLMHHPHIHCLVPAGGLSKDQKRWVSSPEGFFVSVRVLSRRFRTIFLSLLQRAYDKGQIRFTGHVGRHSSSAGFREFIHTCRRNDWVVYAKRPFGSPELVLKYLARYTHRVAISNARILSIHEGKVTFRCRMPQKAGESRPRSGTMTLDGHEFLRRFLLHVLPKNFYRIRHFGFLSNRNRRNKVALARKLLDDARAGDTVDLTSDDAQTLIEAKVPHQCPSCKQPMVRAEKVAKSTAVWLVAFFADTS